jgi:hypothetical protein
MFDLFHALARDFKFPLQVFCDFTAQAFREHNVPLDRAAPAPRPTGNAAFAC